MTTHTIAPPTQGVPMVTLCCGKRSDKLPEMDVLTWGAGGDCDDDGTLEIPRPHVPFGPAGMPEALADADYLDHAARNISGGYAVGGYNVTATVVKLLHDTATALRHWERHGKHWWACAVNAPRPELRGPCDCDLSRAGGQEGAEQ